MKRLSKEILFRSRALQPAALLLAGALSVGGCSALRAPARQETQRLSAKDQALSDQIHAVGTEIVGAFPQLQRKAKAAAQRNDPTLAITAEAQSTTTDYLTSYFYEMQGTSKDGLTIVTDSFTLIAATADPSDVASLETVHSTISYDEDGNQIVGSDYYDYTATEAPGGGWKIIVDDPLVKQPDAARAVASMRSSITALEKADA